MRFDGWNTMEGRHLVYAYGLVILVQGGYFLWTAVQWQRLTAAERAEAKKAAKPV